MHTENHFDMNIYDSKTMINLCSKKKAKNKNLINASITEKMKSREKCDK